MLTARTKLGASVPIDGADPKETYYCPICNQPLIQKRGASVSHHFSHHAARRLVDGTVFSPCSDLWSYDNSDWHAFWLSQFPVAMRERVMTNGNEKHLADVADEHTVILFQHAPITALEYRRRTDFFLACGMKVNWVFDLTEAVASGEIVPNDAQSNMYYWPRLRQPFNVLDYKERRVFVFFQLRAGQDASIVAVEQVSNAYGGSNIFYTDAASCYSVPAFAARFTPAEYRKNDMRNPQSAQVESAPFARPQQAVPAAQNGDAQHALRPVTIQQLWKPEYSSMIVRNVNTDRYILIKGSGGKILRSDKRPDGAIIGKRTFWNDKEKRYDYTKFFIVDGADDPVWVLHKKYFIAKTDQPSLAASAAEEKKLPDASADAPVEVPGKDIEPAMDAKPAGEPVSATDLLHLFFTQDLPDLIASAAGPGTVERIMRDRGEAVVSLVDASASMRSSLYRCPFTPQSFFIEVRMSLSPVKKGQDTGVLSVSIPAVTGDTSACGITIDFSMKDGRVNSARTS